MSATFDANSLNPLNAGSPPAANNNKPLWIAVGVLGAAVLAMGGTLLYTQTRPTATPVVAALSAPATLPPASGLGAGEQVLGKQDEVSKPVLAPVKRVLPATKSVATGKATAAATAATPAPVAQPTGAGTAGSGTVSPAPVVVAQAPTPLAKLPCGNCGAVESSTQVQREGAGTGLGAIAGGVLGAVLGNQVGGGDGKTAATVLGALGGGWAGNTVEKKMRKETVYDVRVRMDDGSSRSFEVATPVSAGAKVTVEGSSLRLADGSLASPLPPRPAPVQQAPGTGPNQRS